MPAGKGTYGSKIGRPPAKKLLPQQKRKHQHLKNLLLKKQFYLQQAKELQEKMQNLQKELVRLLKKAIPRELKSYLLANLLIL